MGYSIQHLRIDKKHILTLIDEQTILSARSRRSELAMDAFILSLL